MNRILLVVLLAGLIGGGVVLADSFQGILATISYHVAGSQQSANILPVNINLGNLTAGASGKYSTNATTDLKSSGYYTFRLNNGALKGEFTSFVVIIKFGNYTIILTKQHHESHKVYIPAGNYTVDIMISYTVSQHAHSETVSNAPLIIVKEENS